MLTDIIAPERTDSVTREGLPEERFHTWMDDMTTRMNQGQNLPIVRGAGSPEGVVSAILDQLYLDTGAGTLYIKGTASGNTGWVAT
jgi:hypothetical protein